MERLQKFSPFYVMDLVREAQRFDDTVHFEVGQPDLPPSPGVRRALAEAVEEGRFAYTESRGLSKLRERISDHYRHEYGVEVDPERILVTPGTSNAFLVAYLLSLEAGDRVGLADPGYPCYPNFAAMVDATPHYFPVDRESGYRIDPAALVGSGIRALHISSPSNPTGTLYDSASLAALAEACRSEGIRLISDELYHGLVYETQAPTALAFDDEAIVINGFSKYFCMPGLRIGWMVVPESLIRPAEIIAQNLYISAPTLSQYAALEAFDYDYLAQVRDTFRRRRDALYDALDPLLPVDARPQGAFYLWCDISRYSDDAMAFSRELLEAIHVAVTPGIDFGFHGTATKIRFAYTRQIGHMLEGVERLREYLTRR